MCVHTMDGSQIVKNLIMQNAMRIKCFLGIVSSAAIPKG
jgi:hypothetical protein